MNETPFSAGLALVAAGGLLLILSGFLRSLPVAVLAATLTIPGLGLIGYAVRPTSFPVLGRTAVVRRRPVGAPEILAEPSEGTDGEAAATGSEAPAEWSEGLLDPPVIAPVAGPPPGIAADPGPAEASSDAPASAPPLGPVEAPWPPQDPLPPEGPIPDRGPSPGWPGPSGPIAGPLSSPSPSLGPPVLDGSRFASSGRSLEAPEEPVLLEAAAERLPIEPMAEPESSPTVKWSGPSLPFAAATDRSQAIRGGGSAGSETWPPILDRSEEDLRMEVERLRQRVEELSTTVLVPGFTVLPSQIQRDTLGLVSRVPEPPSSGPRPPAACSACGDADLTGPTGGNRCWGCGRSVCASCFWRYGPGPALHRCPS
ncbi:MAG: hypothetical protein L3K08_00735, partial [Thermoplasmata archaeon]|nr:hypothetical protein [Thermoplasmata archaeon]